MNVSTIGNRRGTANHKHNHNHKQPNTKDSNTKTLEVVTARVLEQLERNSDFFDQNPPKPLPCFEPSEVELRDVLGQGEFGVVLQVSALHVVEDCPCSRCSQLSRDREQQIKEENVIAATNVQKKRKEHRRRQRQKPRVMIEGMPTSNPSLHSDHNNHRAPMSSFSRGVSFAEDDTKLEDDDYSTVSTNDDDDDDDEWSLSGPEDALLEDHPDGEVDFLKGYMSQHCFRAGRTRYAVKRLHLDLSRQPENQQQQKQLEAALDLAGEAKFMASLNHPNICKMRGTIGQPGSFDFMIVMDCLQMTLREKMDTWQDKGRQDSNKLGGLFDFWKKRSSSHTHNKALEEEDVFADKLLAVYDIARAMRYLHNHQIIFRDLKPENLAFDLRGDMRLFDFGLAKELKQKDMVEAPDGFNATGLTGSRRYMAPEVILCKPYGLSADVYSYAILVWEVFSDRTPFPTMSLDKHFEHVVLKHKRPKTIKSLPKEMHNLIDNAWSHERSERPPFKSICERLASQLEVLNCTNGGARSITSDRTAQLMNRSLRSRLESNESIVNAYG